MKLKLYNTLSKKKEEFKPISSEAVKLYTCGPTVYNFAHIGNLRSYCAEDLVKRTLKYFGYKVYHVMNITDVEDKIIRRCISENKTLQQLTAPYEKAFNEDLESLNIIKADVYPKASEHIPEITSMIKGLLKKGIAYKGSDGSYYFSIDKFPKYGQLIRLDRSEMKCGVRINNDEYAKDQACDFALWKAWDIQDGNVFWETELGKGRPGWHIECSAMSMKYLGETFDIHMGGVDNIFPHHENELAQSEALTGKKFVKYWVHCEHLLSENQKMSKSLGNFYTLRDLTQGKTKTKKFYSPTALRYFYISNHYGTRLNFTLKALEDSENTVYGLQEFVRRLSSVTENQSDIETNAIQNIILKTKSEFEEKIADDLNTPQALAALFSGISEINSVMASKRISKEQAEIILNILFSIDDILGLELKKAAEKRELPEELKNLMEERQKARQERNFKLADDIRSILASKGIIVQDSPGGSSWTIKKT